MPKKKQKDKSGRLTDNKDYGNEVIGGIRLVIPINRNLSLKLFGQLGNLIEENS